MRRQVMFASLGLVCFAGQAGSQPFAAGSEEKRPDLGRPEQHKALVRRWIEEGFNRKNPKVVDDIFAEGIVVNGQRIGREGLRQSMSRHLAAFPDLHVTVTDVVAEAENVGIWYRVEGTHRGEFDGIAPTGKPVRWTGVDLLRILEGRVVEARFLSDSLGLLRQLTARTGPQRGNLNNLMASVALPDELDQVLRDYERAWQAHDARALSELFTEDGFVLADGRPPVRGRAAIRAGYSGSGGPLSLRPLAFDAADSVGYVVRAFRRTPAGADVGKFVLTLRRSEADGWLITSDIDNFNERSPAPTLSGSPTPRTN